MLSAQPLRVFISYSHDSEDHAEQVLGLADRLRRGGIDAWIDQYETAPAKGWPRWMEEQVERADVVLCVCTETYRRRFDQKEEANRGLGVTWEGALVRIGLYLDQGENQKFLPVLFEPDDTRHIPRPLQAFTHFQLGSSGAYETLYRHLTDQPKVVAPELGAVEKLPAKNRRSLLGANLPTDLADAPGGTEAHLPDTLAAYAEWAREKYAHLELIGIDAGDVSVQLEEVYVPLRVHHRRRFEPGEMGLFRGLARGFGDDTAFGDDAALGDGDSADIEIEDLLRPGHVAADATRHALIFGEPGSGKTTALLKLHQLCWTSPEALGLDPGTVPVFLRLRHLSPALLDQGLAAFLDHEVKQRSGGRLGGLGENSSLGEDLWSHGRLLLLFDGLDEIADAEHRAEVLRQIAWTLGPHDAARVRAVVSCRRVGLPGREADRDQTFGTYEVRPFQDDQIAQLVRLWFRELTRRGKIEPATAERRVTTILGALADRKRSSQQILQMASNPLLLTLLCVVVLLGNEIPRKRVRFYEQCLDVLLDRWPRQRGKEGPVDLTAAREALAHLAFFLHSARRRDDLAWADAVAELMTCLGETTDAEEFFDWAHEDVGLLVDTTEEEFGFVHLGLQEHLTARHLIHVPEAFDFLDGDFDETWWTEVFLQVSALSDRTGFDTLMTRLLQHTDALERRSGLLRDCLAETTRPDLSAFVKVLGEPDETRQLAVLRLLGGLPDLPTPLVEILENLARSPHPAVARAAAGLLGARAEAAESRLALLIVSQADLDLAENLADRLRNWHGGWPAEVLVGTGRKNGKRLKGFATVIALIGNPGNAGTPGDWKTCESLRKIYHHQTWLTVPLPGEPRPTIPEVLGDCATHPWQLGNEDELIEWIGTQLPDSELALEPEPEPVRATRGLSLGVREAEPVATRSASKEAVPKGPFTEKITGMVFLPVPGGRFVMGSDDLFSEKEQKKFRDQKLEWLIQAPTPACRVRLSPYWLARTPVTNHQYAAFLEATGHPEPKTWRDRRFSDPQQPVVNVHWEDADTFCRWLSEASPTGHEYQLPSEAQWELAARGPQSRLYPWGEQPPDPSLACYGLDYGNVKPAAVGTYPGGAGPFDHLDLAGSVWEWCRDAWEPDHSRWARGEPLDPVGTGDLDFRPLRGGSWFDVAVYLRSAFRFGNRPRVRYGFIGFRVLCAPPSSVS